MRYKHNEGVRRSVSVVNVILSLLVIFLSFVAWSCSSEARKGAYDLIIFEDGSFRLYTSEKIYSGCLSGELCNGD